MKFLKPSKQIVSTTTVLLSCFAIVTVSSNSVSTDAAFAKSTHIVSFSMADNKWIVDTVNGLTNLNGPWVLYWGEAETFLSYEIQVSTSSNMANPRTYTKTYTPETAPGWFSSGSVELTGMPITMGSTYYTRIRVLDSPSPAWSAILPVKATNGYT